MKVDLGAMEVEVKETAVLEQRIVQEVRRAQRKTEGSLEERLEAGAAHALSDIEEMLEYQYDESGNKCSAIDPKLRLQANIKLLEMAAIVRGKRNGMEHMEIPRFKVEFNINQLPSMVNSARMIGSAKVIEGTIAE